MNDFSAMKPPTWFWAVAILGLIWEILGFGSYLYHVTLTPEAIQALPEGQRRLMEMTPPWVNGAFAIATVGGLLGALGLVLRRRWAKPLLLLSVLAIVVQFGWVFLGAKAHELIGPSSAIAPAFILAFGLLLSWFAGLATRRGWLR
jgi:hypothetical protein